MKAGKSLEIHLIALKKYSHFPNLQSLFIFYLTFIFQRKFLAVSKFSHIFNYIRFSSVMDLVNQGSESNHLTNSPKNPNMSGVT